MAALLLSQFGSPAWSAIEVVVFKGDDSPDGNGELTLHSAPTINAAGELAFWSELTGTAGGSADNQALFRRETTGALTLIARRGQTFNGQPINTLFPTNANIDSSGIVWPVLALGPPTVLHHAFGDGGPLMPMYVNGSPSPSGNNTLLGVLNAVTNDSGVSVMRAVYNGANPETGLYERAPNGALTTRLLRGATLERGGTENGFFSRPTINETNQIGVVLDVSTMAGSVQSAARIDGATVYEVREGDVGVDGITITDVKPLTAFVSDMAHLAFVADFTRPNLSIGQGVFLSDTDGTRLVAGGSLPGAVSPAENVQLLGISSSGRVALTSEFFGGSDRPSGMYVADTTGPTLVAFEDTATPVPGKFFRGFFNEATVMNDAGQLAFLADLSDVVNGPSTGRGLYFYDSAGGLQQIARTGDTLEGSTISGLFFFGTVDANSLQGPDTSRSGLSNAGQVAFGFTLADGGNGIAIWSPDELDGDFNEDGVVDAADYVVWRKNDGTPQGYDAWRVNFGGTSGAGSAFERQRVVPEAATLSIAMVSFAALLVRRRFRPRWAR